MITRKSISRMFSILLIIMFLLTGVLPVQANALASPLFASGDFAWAKGMGGADYDVGKNIAVDSNGNVYTTGFFSGTVDFDPGAVTFNLTSAGSNDIFISKLDSNGGLVWAKSVGGTDFDDGRNIAVDSNGNVYTTGLFSDIADFDPGAGTFNLTSTGYFGDIFVSKLDNNGDFVWAKSMAGVDGHAESYSIDVDSSGNVYTTGYFFGTVDFDPDMVGTYNLTGVQYDIFLSKLDSNGDFVWAKSMGGTNNDISRGIAADSNSNVYTTGYFQGTADFDPGVGIFNLTSAVGGSGIFVSKLDSNGDFLWAKSMGSGTHNNCVGNDIAADPSGNIYTTGYFFGIADFDPGVGTFNLTSAGGSDIFVSKLDGNGDFVWAKGMSGTSDGSSSGIALDSSNNIYVTGDFEGTADFDPGVGTFNLASAGLRDIFVSNLDSSGNFIWAKSLGGAENDSGFDIALDSNGNVYTTGYFIGAVDFDPGAGTFNLISAGNSDIFISKLEKSAIFVNWNASGANNGTSWTDAYTDLQSALSVASSGADIWVAAGTYKPTTGSDRTATFQLTDGAALYGGFNGSETLRNQRDPAANVTTLSGDLSGNDVGFTNNIENVYHVVNGATGATLDGFTITAGNANGSSVSSIGGGMLNNYSNPILTNIIFSRNSASLDGGGMYNNSSSPILANISFSENSAVWDGGGMRNFYSNPTLTNVTFNDNSANTGKGGGMFNDSSNPTLMNVTFSGNSALDSGGGMFNKYSSPMLMNVTFSANSAIYYGGGGIYNHASNPTLMNVTISGNSATSVGGGVSNDTTSNPQIRNTIFWGNTAPSGAQIYNIDIASSPVVSDSVIEGGYAGGTDIITSSPLLGTLGNYGGSTQTIPLLPGSSAIDTGNNAACASTDQRGTARPQGTHCDIGAFELEAYILTITSANGTVTKNPDKTTYHEGDVVQLTATPNASWSFANWTGDLISSINPDSITIHGNTSVTANYTFDNQAPTNITISNSSVAENKESGTTVGTFNSTDPNTGNTFTYSLVSSAGSADNIAFTISNNALKTAYPFNAMVKNSYSIRVRTTDQGNLYFEKIFAITVINLPAIFADVSDSYWAVTSIERLYNAGITGGCTTVPLNYCPTTPVTRAQMAIFLLRGMHGSTYTPPAATGTKFNDVPLGTFGAAWIEQLAAEGITSGCSGGNYCPTTPVSRAQMAIFLVRAKYGIAFTPPTATGIFPDVPITSFGADYIEQLFADAITSGCGGENYCPNIMVKRDAMAVFLVKTFGLP